MRSAAVVDISGSYKIIWLFPAALLFGKAAIMTRLRVPVGHEHTDVPGIFALMKGGITRQMRTPLFARDVTADDADTTGLLDRMRIVAGDPYQVVHDDRSAVESSASPTHPPAELQP